MEEKNRWSYKVTSHTKTQGLTQEQIDGIMNCYKCEEYQEFRTEMREKNKQYDQYPVAKWQLEKSDDIEQTWHDKLKYEIRGDEVYAEVEFEITLPESFDKGDVVQWCEGFHRLRQIYPMMLQKEIIKLHKAGEEIPENFYKIGNSFLEDLSKSQTLEIKQL